MHGVRQPAFRSELVRIKAPHGCVGHHVRDRNNNARVFSNTAKQSYSSAKELLQVGKHGTIERVENATHNISVFLTPFRSIIGSARGITQSSSAFRLVDATGA